MMSPHFLHRITFFIILIIVPLLVTFHYSFIHINILLSPTYYCQRFSMNKRLLPTYKEAPPDSHPKALPLPIFPIAAE